MNLNFNVIKWFRMAFFRCLTILGDHPGSCTNAKQIRWCNHWFSSKNFIFFNCGFSGNVNCGFMQHWQKTILPDYSLGEKQEYLQKLFSKLF